MAWHIWPEDGGWTAIPREAIWRTNEKDEVKIFFLGFFEAAAAMTWWDVAIGRYFYPSFHSGIQAWRA
jgi:hypothetical protein